LSSPSGLRLSTSPGRWTWPGRVDGLVDAFDGRLAPIVGARALLAVAESEATLRDARLTNRDEKTVARISVEDGFSEPALAPRVTLTPVRGYGREAKRAGGCWPAFRDSSRPTSRGSTPRWPSWAATPATTPARSTSAWTDRRGRASR